MSKVLVLTGDIIGERIAGPAIRAIQIAHVLTKRHQVTLACPEFHRQSHDFPFEIRPYHTNLTARLINQYEVAIIPGSLILPNELTCCLVIDLYDPFILSNLHRFQYSGKTELLTYNAEFDCLLDKLRIGDFFMCATERQRDFWLGMLAAVKRINRQTYSMDPHLYSLIDIVPFGILEELPEKRIRSPFPETEPNARWLLWAGGIWNWFDPIILLKAVAELKDEIPDLKLFFMGTKHPDPRMPQMKMAVETIELSDKLGLTENTVFFGDWIPYEERGSYLTASYAGVSIHKPHLETRYSFRTRILDYIWARVPIICTEGDFIGDIVHQSQLGLTVSADDLKSLKNALKNLYLNQNFYQECKSNLSEIAPDFLWEKVLKPLSHFCDNPVHAPDKIPELNIQRSELTFVCGSESRDQPAGEITRNSPIRQMFSCKFNGLCRIDLNFATYARINSGLIYLSLFDHKLNSTVFIAPINMEKISDNDWCFFPFGPIPDSAGRTYSLKLEAPNAKPGNAVTVWVDPNYDSEFDFQNNRISGSISFRAFCASEIAQRKMEKGLKRLFNRKFF